MKGVPRYAIAGAVALVVTAIASSGRVTPYDNYVLLAQALRAGHLWITWPGPFIDAVQYGGLWYVIEAPLPALLLLPASALGNLAQSLLSIVLTGVAVGAAWELGSRLGLRPGANAWICAFLLAGTDLLWCGMLGGVWFLAHVGAVCFTLLALVELCGKRRAWLVMLWAACAFESRFSLVLAVPVYAYVILSTAGVRERRARIAGMLAVLVPVAVGWLSYNELRFGTWDDIGYTLWFHSDPEGMPTGSPFALRYLVMQFSSFFVQWPSFVNAYPWIVPSYSTAFPTGPTSLAITWTSPGLLLAFFARAPRRLVGSLWAATVLCAAPNFFYYVNGFQQFGMRHALDFEPFALALMMLAARERLPRWAMALMAYSIAVGLWGCWYWQSVVR
ncbi:MAG: hypothetical protein ACREMP_04755 [Candidatus Tyrphobacter sp.]